MGDSCHRNSLYRYIITFSLHFDAYIIFILLLFCLLSPIVAEAKTLWKKAKDAHRYFALKKGKQQKTKSGDAAPELDEDDAEPFDDDMMDDELNFLDETSSTNYRQTFSVGGESTIGESSVDRNDEASGEASSNYSYMAKKNKRDDATVEAAQLVSQTIASYFEAKKDGENTQTKEAKYKHAAIWSQLESLFEQLDDATITDLNFEFISITYKAIVAKRNK